MIASIGSARRKITSYVRSSTRSQSLSTYYDSQSGLHLPVHNEREVSIFLDKSTEEISTTSYVPAQLYKEDASSDMPDKLRELVERGIAGLCLPPAQFPRDLRNLQTLDDICPTGFRFFGSIKTPLSKPLASLSLLLKFTTSASNLEDEWNRETVSGMSSTIVLGEELFVSEEPISVANQVAALIDSTGCGDYLWLTPPLEADDDDVIQLCEELMYLDVAGPTIKSRIIIDSVKEEILDEAMLVGINKFVVTDESQVDVVSDIAKWQGKEIRR